jgi:hypothetical protein
VAGLGDRYLNGEGVIFVGTGSKNILGGLGKKRPDFN